MSCRAPCFQWAGGEKGDQSPHGRDGHAPLLLQSPISKGQWYQLFSAFFEFCKLIWLRLTLAGLPAAVVLRLNFNYVEYLFLSSKN
jgi:hypothetical protein